MTDPSFRFDPTEEPTTEIEIVPQPARLMATSREAVAALLIALAITASMAIGALATLGAMVVLRG